MSRVGFRSALLFSTAIATVAFAGSAALAQEVAASSPAAEQVVLDELVVSATKQEERAIDAMAGVSVRTRDELQSWQTQRIGTTISGMPGVTTQENPNDPATAVNIRGLQDFGRVAVTVDGARQNFQRSGHNANGAFFLDPAFVRTVDVTRGPVANIYGSGAIGGVVSFETLRPSDVLRAGERAAMEATGGAVLGRQRGGNITALGAFRPYEWVSGLLGLSYRNLGDYRDGSGVRVNDSGSNIVSGLGKLVVNPGEGQTLTLGGQYQRYNFANGAGTATDPRRDNDVKTGTFTGHYRIARPDLPWLDLNLSVYDTFTNTDQMRVSGTPAQMGSRYFRINTTGVDIYNTSRFDFGGPKLALTYGADYFRDRVSTNDPVGNGDETTPSGRRSVYGGFAQAHLNWSIVDVIGALRYDAYELSGGRTSSSGDRISPKLTLGISPIHGVQFYGTYAEGYRAPSITETLVDGLHPVPAAFTFRPNPNLKPEIGKTVEAGVNLKFDDVFMAGDRFRSKMSVFQNDVKDYIDGVFVDPGAPCGAPIPGACNDAFYSYQNVAKARLRGFEAEFAYDAGNWFATLAGSTIRGDNQILSQPLASVYPDKLIVGAGLRFFDQKLSISGRVTMVDKQERVPAGSPTSKGYALVDLAANYKISEYAKAFVTLDNIGNVTYTRYRDADRSPGFVAKLGLTTRLGI